MSYVNMDHAGWVESSIAASKPRATKAELRKAKEENRHRRMAHVVSVGSFHRLPGAGASERGDRMSNANHLRDANPWHPIDDKVDLKHLGKLGEELSELAAASSKCATAVCRCIIQGVDEAEPVTGKVNREWLEDEIADVQANMDLVFARLGI
jgi:hypothetical protein